MNQTKTELWRTDFVLEKESSENKKQSFGLKNKVIMTKKAPIKIIKREERSRTQESGANESTNKKSAQETAREMVNTVSNWVNEFQQKRRVETTKAIKTLFPEPPQPSEA